VQHVKNLGIVLVCAKHCEDQGKYLIPDETEQHDEEDRPRNYQNREARPLDGRQDANGKPNPSANPDREGADPSTD